MRSLLTILVLISFSANAQLADGRSRCKAYSDPANNHSRLLIDHIGLLGELNRYAVFAGPAIVASRGHMNLDAALMAGIDQLSVGGFNPRIRLGAGYYFIDRVFVHFGPALFLAASSLNPDKTPRGRIFDYEMLAGYKLVLFPGRFKLYHTATFGLISRSVFNTISEKRIYATNFGYAIGLGMLYEL